jgi:hypothetical protein
MNSGLLRLQDVSDESQPIKRIRLVRLVVLVLLSFGSGQASLAEASSGQVYTRNAVSGRISVAAVRGPRRVRPGKRVRLLVSGFPRGSRVRVQFGVLPIPNCCVSYVIPGMHHPGFFMGATGQTDDHRYDASAMGAVCRSQLQQPELARLPPW